MSIIKSLSLFLFIIPAIAFSELKYDIPQKFFGCGFNYKSINSDSTLGPIVVIGVIKNSPADNDIKIGDTIVEVNSFSTANQKIPNIMDSIKFSSKHGNKVCLTINRSNLNKLIKINILRDTICCYSNIRQPISPCSNSQSTTLLSNVSNNAILKFDSVDNIILDKYRIAYIIKGAIIKKGNTYDTRGITYDTNGIILKPFWTLYNIKAEIGNSAIVPYYRSCFLYSFFNSEIIGLRSLQTEVGRLHTILSKICIPKIPIRGVQLLNSEQEKIVQIGFILADKNASIPIVNDLLAFNINLILNAKDSTDNIILNANRLCTDMLLSLFKNGEVIPDTLSKTPFMRQYCPIKNVSLDLPLSGGERPQWMGKDKNIFLQIYFSEDYNIPIQNDKRFIIPANAKLLSIDGKSINNFSLDSAKSLLKGLEGTVVSIVTDGEPIYDHYSVIGYRPDTTILKRCLVRGISDKYHDTTLYPDDIANYLIIRSNSKDSYSAGYLAFVNLPDTYKGLKIKKANISVDKLESNSLDFSMQASNDPNDYGSQHFPLSLVETKLFTLFPGSHFYKIQISSTTSNFDKIDSFQIVPDSIIVVDVSSRFHSLTDPYLPTKLSHNLYDSLVQVHNDSIAQAKKLEEHKNEKESIKQEIDILYCNICKDMKTIKMFNDKLKEEEEVTKRSGIVNQSERYEINRRLIYFENEIGTFTTDYKKKTGKQFDRSRCINCEY